MSLPKLLLASFLGVLMFFSLLIGSVAIGITRSVDHPGLATLLSNDSTAYAMTIHYIDAQIPTVITLPLFNRPVSLSLNQREIHQALVQSLPRSIFNRDIVNITQANKGWIVGDASRPSFSINLVPMETTFTSLMAKNFNSQLTNLPRCSLQQLYKFVQSPQLGNISCLPPSVNLEIKASEIAPYLLSSPRPFNIRNITSQNISPGIPYYQRLKWLPQLYAVLRIIPVLLATIFVASLVILYKYLRRQLALLIGILATAGAGIVMLSYGGIYSSANSIAMGYVAHTAPSFWQPLLRKSIGYEVGNVYREVHVFGVSLMLAALCMLVVYVVFAIRVHMANSRTNSLE